MKFVLEKVISNGVLFCILALVSRLSVYFPVLNPVSILIEFLKIGTSRFRFTNFKVYIL
jgi:hypothetical protein